VLPPRVAIYGQLAPECASTYYKYGYALLLKVKELAFPIGDVPKKARKEASLRSTESKAHTRHSMTPGSNHENAPYLDEDNSENGI
jgi:nuclear autoantigenic sperm protein